MTKKRFTIALIGRPNVGKSALFNAISNQRVSIVDEEEGVTRDRIAIGLSYYDRNFTLVDTGGIGFASQENTFAKEIKEQAEKAIIEADALVFVVDGRVGLLEEDRHLFYKLRALKKPLIVAVNKVDDLQLADEILLPFYALSADEMVAVSALHRLQIDDLLEKSLKTFTEYEEEDKNSFPKVAVIGRANVGKSTLINALSSQDRMIVSPIAGTTRDSISLQIDNYIFIDTAGIRRKKAEQSVIDKFAFMRTEKAIISSDICLMILDASVGIQTQDHKILSLIKEHKKGCIFLWNKWDLLNEVRMEHCLKAFHQSYPVYRSFPMLFISAKEKNNLDKIFPLIDEVFSEYHKKIGTGALNACLEKAIQKNPPAMTHGKRLRIYYGTQISEAPPRFLFFVNYPYLITPPYKRYLLKQLREEFSFQGVFLDFFMRGKKPFAKKEK